MRALAEKLAFRQGKTVTPLRKHTPETRPVLRTFPPLPCGMRACSAERMRFHFAGVCEMLRRRVFSAACVMWTASALAAVLERACCL